jgi:hypothetical protein
LIGPSLLLLGTLIAVPVGAQTGPLRGAIYLPAEGGPIHVVAEDVTGDEHADLLVAAEVGGQVLLLQGDGQGDFEPPRTFPVSGRPSRVAVSDLDGDGLVDLLWLDGSAGSLHWAYAIPGPTLFFGGGGFHLEGEEVGELLITDLDGDDRPDVVVSISGGDQIALHYNRDGAPAPPVLHRVGDRPGPLAVLEPGEGGPRLVVGQAGVLSQDIALYEGPGIALRQEVPLGSPVALTATPWNDDGRLDLVVLADGGDRVRVQLQGEDGLFVPGLSAAVGPGARALAVLEPLGDLQRLLVGEPERGRVRLLEGHPGENLLSRGTWFVGSRFETLVAADLDGDGRPEVVVPQPDDNRLALVRQNGAGLGAYVSVPVGFAPHEVALAPAGPSLPVRVAVAHETSPALRLYRPYDGSLRPSQTLEAPLDLTALEWSDVDGDGLLDLSALQPSTGVLVYRSAPGGDLLAPVLIPVEGQPTAFAFGDMDGDGEVDMAIGEATESRVLLRRGDGSGGFEPFLTLETSLPPVYIRMADLDLDGRADLQLLDGSPYLSLYFSEGTTLTTPVRPLMGSDPRDILLGHLNADTYPDFVFPLGQGDGAYTSYVSTAPRVYRIATFREPVSTGLQQAALADVSGDGRLDLLLTAVSVQGLTVREGLGDGNFSSPFPFVAAQLPGDVAAGDLDGDLLADVALLDVFSRTLHLMYQQPAPLVPVEEAGLWALRQENGVLLRAESAASVSVRRVRDGRRLELQPAGEGIWSGWDPAPGPGRETYVLLDASGRELARAEAAPAGSVAQGSRLALAPPAPNPGTGSVLVRFRAPTAGEAELSVVDARGRRILRLDPRPAADGWWEARWNGRDHTGHDVARGRYQMVLSVGGRSTARAVTWLGR